MNSILDRYLDRVLVYANKPGPKAEAIRKELKDHLLQKVDDLIKSGVPREEATLEALRQHGSPKIIGYKLRGPFPWIDIRTHGTARGVIAIGPRAVGIFAMGGYAMGIFTFGGFCCGLFSVGGFALGLLFAWGGFGMGGIASGGMTLGVVAVGGMAAGVVVAGGLAVGAWVPYGLHHGNVISHYTPANVPPLLKSLDPILNDTAQITDHFAIIMPAFLLTLLAFQFLLYREGKRVASEDDWLIDG
ncbi:MAG: permease prefix domain 1-containing protein [Methylacidiphilales bacterium]|nr:permease prefix domain 1-containing protein [Candidatus Methylacidiphilales bacterium]